MKTVNEAKLLKRLFEKSRITKKKRWDEFREFHKQMIDVIGDELGEEIPAIKGVDRAHQSFGLEFTAKDYAWWGLQENCDILPLRLIKAKVRDTVASFLNTESVDVDMELAEEILSVFTPNP